MGKRDGFWRQVPQGGDFQDEEISPGKPRRSKARHRPAIPAEVTRTVLFEAGYRCSVCGVECPLERAHIVPWRKVKEHAAENLICLCANCHARADSEGWSQDTLRQFKLRPWVLRHRDLAGDRGDQARAQLNGRTAAPRRLALLALRGPRRLPILVAIGVLGLLAAWLAGPAHSVAAAGTIGVAVYLLLMLLLARDKTAMGRHPDDADLEFPERDFREKRRSFCNVLRTHLIDMNQRLNWSDANFVPLDAEVEVQRGTRTVKRHSNLLRAIRSDKTSQAILILGDPGSGKSIALRKLTLELLDEVETTERVPIYINLKEWSKSKEWTKDNPPVPDDLFEFIHDYLASNLDMFAREFLRFYYRRMVEHGRFFLLLDSFDEIPAVLDADESSWIVEKLSAVISLALSGNTRGVVASRLFRRLRLATRSHATFTIRPFSDFQIAGMLRKSFLFRESILQTLFRDRPELVSIVRNPLAAELLRVYLNEHQGFLPESQLELFQSYVETRLRTSSTGMDRPAPTAGEIYRTGQEIAWLMFRTPGAGLEMPVAQLARELGSMPVGRVTTILTEARLARRGSIGSQHFSFVHRRFFEYFLARHFIANPELVDVCDIRRDSRARDALVLFCEVADEPKAVAVADACWERIHSTMLADREESRMSAPEYLEGIHCLRFLSDAFRARFGCLRAFQNELAAYVERAIKEGKNLLEKKHALEATGLLKPEDIERSVSSALSLGADWISETAMRACRHLPRLGRHLRGNLGFYLASLSTFAILRRRQELMFALGLSEAFYGLRRYCRMRILDGFAMAGASIVLLAVHPALVLVLLCFLGADQAVRRFRRAAPARNFSEEGIVNVRVLAAAILAANVCVLGVLGHAPAFFDQASGSDLGVDGGVGGSADTSQRMGGRNNPLKEPRPETDAVTVMVKSIGEMFVFRFLDLTIGYSTPFLMIGEEGLGTLWLADLVLAALTMPWYFFFGLVFELQRTQNPRRVLVVGCIVVAFLGLWIGISSMLPAGGKSLSRREDEPEWPVLLMLGAMAAVWIGYFVLKTFRFLRQVFEDWRRLAAARASLSLERESIERTFHSFATSWGRERYVELLEHIPARPRGKWAEGLPNADNDRASQLLAQMEERWLGLAR